MVVLSLTEYASLTANIEKKLDEADELANSTSTRLTHEQVFGSIRKMINK